MNECYRFVVSHRVVFAMAPKKKEITLPPPDYGILAPGEENFYTGKPEYEAQFFVEDVWAHKKGMFLLKFWKWEKAEWQPVENVSWNKQRLLQKRDRLIEGWKATKGSVYWDTWLEEPVSHLPLYDFSDYSTDSDGNVTRAAVDNGGQTVDDFFASDSAPFAESEEVKEELDHVEEARHVDQVEFLRMEVEVLRKELDEVKNR